MLFESLSPSMRGGGLKAEFATSVASGVVEDASLALSFLPMSASDPQDGTWAGLLGVRESRASAVEPKRGLWISGRYCQTPDGSREHRFDVTYECEVCAVR